MLTINDLPESLPVFPLSGALLLPRARLPLHIFEPRYLAMVEDALATRPRLIGMIQPSGERLHHFGCAGRITGFRETDEGHYMISLTGVARFRLGTEEEGFQPYRRFSLIWDDFMSDLMDLPDDPDFDRTAFFALLRRYFERNEMDGDWENLAHIGDELLVNSLSAICPFSPEEKQVLLESPSLSDRRNTLIALMEFSLCHVQEGGLQ